jgi:putative peptide zinc metalloprotease protein
MISGTADLQRYQGLDPRIPADTGNLAPSFLLFGPQGSQVRVSASAHRLLALAARHDSTEGVAKELAAVSSRPITTAQVAAKLAEVLETLRDAEVRAARNSLPRGFWLRIRLASSTAVARACRPLTWFFHPAAAVLILAATGSAVAALFHRHLPPAGSGQGFWAAYGLFFLSLLLHELGHAAACVRYGAQPAEIGFTVYLLFPALYSDVSSAWRLRRWQREVVDLAGAYLQFAVGAVYIFAFLAGAGEIFRTAFLMILYTSLFSLNPVFKFDGYWLVADALGVTNLSRQPARIARWAAGKIRRRPVPPLPWPPWVVAVLVVYSVASVSVWGLFFLRLLPWLAGHLASMPFQVADLLHTLARRDAPAAWRAVTAILPAAGMTAAAATTVISSVAPLRQMRRRRPLPPQDQPPAAAPGAQPETPYLSFSNLRPATPGRKES